MRHRLACRPHACPLPLRFALCLTLLALPGTKTAPAQSLYEKLEVRSPLPTPNHLTALRAAGGKLVAIGDKGTIISSSDGVTWQSHRTGYAGGVTDIAFGNGLWVISGADSGTILTSTDLAAWTSSRPAGIGFNNWSLTFAEGKFFMGSTGSIASSVDGVSWESHPLPVEDSVQNILFAGGQFVAVGNNGLIVTSPGGGTWTARASGLDPDLLSSDLLCIRHLNGHYVAGGKNGTLLTSPDGITWTKRPYAEENDWLWDAAYHAGSYYFTGRQGRVRMTGDFTAWAEVATGVSGDLHGIAALSGQHVVIGRDGSLASSPDFAAWTNRQSKVAAGFSNVAFGAGKFAAAAFESTIYTSADALTWTAAFTPPEGTSWNDLVFADGRFIALNYNGAVSQSVDGVTWSLPAGGFDGFPSVNCLRRLNGRWFVAGNNGLLRSTADFSAWSTHDVADPVEFSDMTYAEGVYLAVGTGGAIYTSADGTAWTARDSGVTQQLRGMVRAAGRFVAAGAQSAVTTSVNGIDWSTTGLVNAPFNTLKLVARGGQFVAIGPFGAMSTSPDGLAWTPLSLPVSTALSDLAEGNGLLVAVGNNGLIMSAALPAQYALAITPDGNGSVTRQPEQATYEEGGSVILTAVPQAGHSFSHWSGDASGAANPLTVSMDAAKHITAHFIPALSGFDLWLLNTFTEAERANPAIGGPLANPDDDALVNLQEYLHGTNPKTEKQFAPVTQKAVSLTGNHYAVLGYRRGKAATDVTQTIERSTDLQTWAGTDGGGASWVQLYNLQDHGDGTETIEWRTTAPLAPGAPVFLRLKLTR